MARIASVEELAAYAAGSAGQQPYGLVAQHRSRRARSAAVSDLWNPEKFVPPTCVPSAGEILAALSNNRVGGEDHDKGWATRAKQTLW